LLDGAKNEWRCPKGGMERLPTQTGRISTVTLA
jgi:hypothetical protein